MDKLFAERVHLQIMVLFCNGQIKCEISILNCEFVEARFTISWAFTHKFYISTWKFYHNTKPDIFREREFSEMLDWFKVNNAPNFDPVN
jgi:hypothetical protein